MPDIRLPVFMNDERSGEEDIPAESLGGSRFRIVASPGMVEGLAAGDEIEIDDTERLGYRVLRRSGNLCVWFYFPEPVHEDHPEVQTLAESVETIGGWLDGGYSRMVVFTIPVKSGFEAVERVLDAAVAGLAGSTWLYGNVYDQKDGKTPLGWWLTSPS
jgi:hypothetical protein